MLYQLGKLWCERDNLATVFPVPSACPTEGFPRPGLKSGTTVPQVVAPLESREKSIVWRQVSSQE